MPESPTQSPLTATALNALPRVGEPALDPNGAFIITAVASFDDAATPRAQQLHWVSTLAPFPSRPLTPSDLWCSDPAVSPDGRRVAFVARTSAGEPPQVSVLSIEDGSCRVLTDFPLGAAEPRWMPDGRQLVVRSNVYRSAPAIDATRRLRDQHLRSRIRPHVTEDRVFRHYDRWLTDGEVPHLFSIDCQTGASRDLLPDSQRWFDLSDPRGEYDIAPGGDQIAFAADAGTPPRDTLRWGIYLVSTAGGVATCVTEGSTSDGKRPRFSPNGRWLVYGSRLDPTDHAGRARLVRFDRSTREHAVIAEGWDVSPSAWEFADGDTLVVEAPLRGRSGLFRLNVEEDGEPRLIALGGTFQGIAPAADANVYMLRHGFSQPPELARCPIAGGPIEPLTHFTSTQLAGTELGTVEELELVGAESAPIHLFLMFPPGAGRASPFPLVQHIHGGPYGMHADAWLWRWNAHVLAAPGYVVAMVNFHGSRSYGERFASSVLGDWGGKPAEDLLRATDLLIERGIADASRMALIGGSYGGYMVAWLATRTDRFRCGVAHAARFNLLGASASDLTFVCSVDYGGEPWQLPRDRDALERWNPASHTGTLNTPMLVTHGENDFRCPVQNALELYGTLKARNVAARLVHYPDEGHAITKPHNSIHWYGEVHAWLQRYLRPTPEPNASIDSTRHE
jgi:dipeptidyl aminopeptidase/acylaminoacyl peptidase